MVDQRVPNWMNVLLIVMIPHLGQGYELRKWLLNENCGKTIGHTHFAGELLFDGDQDFDECIVTVEPAWTIDQNSRVLFYFTSFDMMSNCEDSNLTIINGDAQGLSYTIDKKKVVTGLAPTMCGTNSSLLQRYQTFYPSTFPGTFTVIFRWNSFARKFHTKFSIKFASYIEGSCLSDDDSPGCSNDRCVVKDISCHSDIDACGTENTNCKTHKGIDIVKAVFKYWYVLAGLAFVVLAVVFWVRRDSIYYSCYNVPVIEPVLRCLYCRKKLLDHPSYGFALEESFHMVQVSQSTGRVINDGT